jgi:coenzyme F420-reducing hydrogenase beta subunit
MEQEKSIWDVVSGLAKSNAELLAALKSLRNTAHGMLAIAEPEITEAVGAINVGCLHQGIREADRVIARAESR